MKAVKLEVIINAGSGTGDKEKLHTRLAEMFRVAGLTAQISMVQTGEEVVQLAQRAARSDADTIVAGGGDGTINSVAAALLDSNKTLGVLPFGTLNHFAKDLHLPLDLEGAVAVIVAGHVASIDVGEVNGRIFLNNSSLGLYPSLVHEREKRRRLGSGKWPAFVWAALAVLRRYPFLDVRLRVGDEEIVSRTPFVFVGNNRYEMETLDIGGRSCLDAGELSLYTTHDTTRVGLIRLALRALFSRLRRESDFVALCTKEIWIGTKNESVPVALDGEVTVMEPPLHYRVRPRGLRVLVPGQNAR